MQLFRSPKTFSFLLSSSSKILLCLSLLACGGLGGGTSGSPLGGSLGGPNLGSGNFNSADGNNNQNQNGGGADASSTEQNAKGDNPFGGGDFSVVNYTPTLDSGVIGPPIYDHPYKPKAIIAGYTNICRAGEDLIKMHISGHALYRGYSEVLQTDQMYDFEPGGTLRIVDTSDKTFVEFPLQTFQLSASADPKYQALYLDRKNSLDLEITTKYPLVVNNVSHLEFYLSDPSYQSNPENYGKKQACPTMDLSDRDSSFGSLPLFGKKPCHDSAWTFIDVKASLLWDNSKKGHLDFDSAGICQVQVPTNQFMTIENATITTTP